MSSRGKWFDDGYPVSMQQAQSFAVKVVVGYL